MKRTLLGILLAGLLFFVPTAHAQLSLGFVGVFNLPQLDIEAEGFGDTSGVTSFGAGLVAQYQLGSNLAIVAQPTYLGDKGAELTGFGEFAEDALDGLLDVNFDGNIKISTVELPILLKYSFTESSARPYVILGPSFGFVSTAEVSIDFSAIVPPSDDEPAMPLEFSGTQDISEDLSSMDLSLHAGLGVDVPMGSAAYFMDARYAFGLTNLISDGDGSLKTKGLQISAGARFPIGGGN